MTTTQITTLVNKYLDDGFQQYSDIVEYLDTSVDQINTTMGTKYPYVDDYVTDTVTEALPEVIDPATVDYSDVIPTKYIRNIMCYLTAAMVLENEDEFEQQYQAYQGRGIRWLQIMVQSYMSQVPTIYVDDTLGGYYDCEYQDYILTERDYAKITDDNDNPLWDVPSSGSNYNPYW